MLWEGGHITGEDTAWGTSSAVSLGMALTGAAPALGGGAICTRTREETVSL